MHRAVLTNGNKKPQRNLIRLWFFNFINFKYYYQGIGL